MNIYVRPGDLSNPGELENLRATLYSRMQEASHFSVSLEDMSFTDLALFNSLLSLYVNFDRHNKQLSYNHCQNERLQALIQKTQMGHVFNN